MLFDQDFLENPDVFFLSTYFSKVGGKSDIISFMVCYINTYRTKNIPLFLVQLNPILSKPGLKKKGREKARV